MNSAILFWFSSSIFRISRSWSRIKFRNERCARDFAHVRTMIVVHMLPLLDSTIFFFIRIGNLEPRFKFQRALRSKKEKEARQIVTKRAATNGFSSFGSSLDPKDGKPLLLLCHCARFSNIVVNVACLADLHAGLFSYYPVIIQSSSSSGQIAIFY